LSDATAVRVPVEGTVTFDNLMERRESGEQAIAEATGEVVFDLGGLEAGNSAAVVLLMAWFRAADRQEKTVRFVGVPSELRSILDLSGMTGVLPLEETDTTEARASEQ
jgi:anti-anti-sigma regulatory factor